MTLRVLIVTEDFRNDGYIAKPIVEAMFASIGRRARIEVLRDPLVGGVERALDPSWLIAGVLDRYPMVDVFVVLVDRDGNAERHRRLRRLETEVGTALGPTRLIVAEHAWQELEVWLLAGHDLPADWTWNDVRTDRDPKERFYEPFARARAVTELPGRGRSRLGPESATRYGRVRQLSPEVADLEQRLHTALVGPR